MVLSQVEKSAFKLAQLKSLIHTSHSEIIENILEQEGDVDFSIPIDSYYKTYRPGEVGFTVLHYACQVENIHLLKCLLKHGADITLKNRNGDTALHILIKKQESHKSRLNKLLVNEVLLSHVGTKNFLNPCNKDGLSHFHAACMVNNSAAVQFFLENGTPVDEPTSMDSELYPGYTPLHFVAMRTNTEVAEILFAHGANVHVTNGKQKTPLHILLERRIEMLDSVGASLSKNGDFHDKLQEQIAKNEKIINMLLENISIDNDCPDSIGLMNFHVACMLQDISTAQHLVDQVEDLNQCVNMDAKLWPGYTALHFAAHVSISTVEMLINSGANPAVKDFTGLTPLDICIERYKTEDFCRVMSLNDNWKNFLFSDGETKLLSLIRAMTDQEQFKKFIKNSITNINMTIPMESPLWSGYTPLHLAVLFAERSKDMPREDRNVKNDLDNQIIRLCSKGADLSIQDSRGRTALHLAYRLNKMTAVELIFRHCHHIPNVFDDDNLSHIHIACATNRKNKLNKIVLSTVGVNTVYKGTSSINSIRPGSTPLHVCLVGRNCKDDLKDKIRILLEAGADPYVEDACGLTPIHRLLEYCSEYGYIDVTKKLFTRVSNDCVVEEYGLSHLHVACQLENLAAVKRLIKNRANVDLAIKYTQRSPDDPLSFLSRYDKCTSLNMNFLCMSESILELLIRHGADVFVQKADGTTFFNSSSRHIFLSILKDDTNLQARMRREFGWTKLHIVCHFLVVDGFEDVVGAELADVNAQVFPNSPLWKGYTPLHLLTYRGQNYYKTELKAQTMSRILLEHGADVTLFNEEQNSPISMMFEYSARESAREQATSLMKYHRNFNVNPVNAQGLSHFHIACYVNDVDAVRGFILHGVDVNHPIGFFARWCCGYTPLHLASKIEVVNSLINHGADIQAEDVCGCNVLSEVLKRDIFDQTVAEKIIECGADINGKNLRGETPFEITASNNPMTMEKLIFFLREGCIVNTCNPITGLGYLSIILSEHSYYQNQDVRMQIVERIMSENSTTTLGRTTLHHIVTVSRSSFSESTHIELFKKSIGSGGDIDVQDNEGKTALHLAVEFSNVTAVTALMVYGADMNVLDTYGKPAISYLTDESKLFCYIIDQGKKLRHILTKHAHKLAYLKLDLAKMNADAVAQTSICNFVDYQQFLDQIIACKNMKLGVRTMCLDDFLTETGAVISYRSLNLSERCKIDDYFESIQNVTEIDKLKNVLNFQYRKAVKRIELFSSAINSFRLLLGFDLPDLCAENIFWYLHNSDLTSIISAQIENVNMEMDVV